MWPFHARNADFTRKQVYENKTKRLIDFLNKLCSKDCTEWTGILASRVGDLSGTSLDYMAKLAHETIHKLDWAYLIQLGARDGKFVIPREEILPIAEDQYITMKWFLLNEL